MKSIANRILYLTLVTMLLTIIVFSFVSYSFASEKVQDLYDHIIDTETTLWSARFEGFLKQKEISIDTLKNIIEKNFSLEILSSPELLTKEFENLTGIMSSMVQTMNYLNLYSWFHPDYTSPELMMLSVRNYDLDGNITVMTDYTYTAEEISGKSWDWFNDALKNDEDNSDPFDWEGYDKKLSSFTKSLYVEGEKVGVIGSDYYIDELKQMMLEQPFMESGYYALLNKDLFFLVHPEHYFDQWQNVYPDDAEETIEILIDESIDSGVIMAGSQKVGFNRMDNGWIVLAVPDMKVLAKDLKRLSVTFLIITAVAVFFVTFISLAIAGSISRPIIDASEFSIRLTKGELDTRISDKEITRKDEIGILCGNLELMRKSLKAEMENLKIESEKSDFLYQELYHRTKNNLQLILAFISLELDETGLNFKQSLESVKNRIFVLSKVQDLISFKEDLSDIKIKDFLSEIISLMNHEYELYHKGIKVALSSDSSKINKQNLVPVGFLINEIFSNILNVFYNHPEAFSILIDVSHNNKNQELVLNFSTDIDESFFSEMTSNDVNLKIIKAISEAQLNGDFQMLLTDRINFRFKFNEI